MKVLKKIGQGYLHTNLIIRILVGLVLGLILALLCPGQTWLAIFGDIFVNALKAIAPVMVFVLISSSLATSNTKMGKKFGFVILLYLLSTFCAAVTAVVSSFLFPQKIMLKGVSAAASSGAPQGIGAVLKQLILNVVTNPVQSVANGNYIGVLFWALLFGIAMKRIASPTSKTFLQNISDAVTQLVRWIIEFAPFGIMGLVFDSVSTLGVGVFKDYGKLLLLLLGTMLTVCLIVDPLVSAIGMHRNPYPLVGRCLKDSGLTAFFTRSSAANIPVNIKLCEKLGLDEDMYSVSIPLGATINMNGAAVTITVLTLATANTVGIHVDFASAILLSLIATFGAAGASGVAGGSLMLVPMACSLFSISNDISMKVVGVGFMLGVLNDSVETMINSSGDVLFAATAEFRAWRKDGKTLPGFMYSRRERKKLGIEKSYLPSSEEPDPEDTVKDIEVSD